jgi:hypothetical protein
VHPTGGRGAEGGDWSVSLKGYVLRFACAENVSGVGTSPRAACLRF